MHNKVHSRRDGHKRLHACILKDRKQHHQPERHRQFLDGPDVEGTTFRAGVPEAARLVRDVVPDAEVAVEEEHGHRADEREARDDGADPERPGVRAQVLCDDVRRRLAGKLGEIRDAPDRTCFIVRVLVSQVKSVPCKN